MPLSGARRAQFVEAFEILGKKAPEVDRATMGDIMRSLGQNPSTEELTQLFDKVAKGGASISCEALLAAADEFEGRMRSKDQEADVRKAFAVFDKDSTGSISAAELRHVLHNLGVDEDEMEEMMKEADKDGNGLINYNEFVAVLFSDVNIPPPVVISEELRPYWDALKSKEEHGRKKEA